VEAETPALLEPEELEEDDDVLIINIPLDIPVLPISNTVVFPLNVAHLHIRKKDNEEFLKMINETEDPVIALVNIKDDKTSKKRLSKRDLYSFGIVARVINLLSYSKEHMRLIVQGLTRVHIQTMIQTRPYFVAKIEKIETDEEDDLKTSTLLDNVLELYSEFITNNPRYTNDLLDVVEENLGEGPGMIADLIASLVNLEIHHKVKILQLNNAYKRLEYLYKILNEAYQAMKIESEMIHRTSSKVEDSQRQYFLRKQIEEIQKELGDQEDFPEISEIEFKAKDANFPAAVDEAFKNQMIKLKRMPPESSDFNVLLNYLELLVEIPWTKSSKDNLNITKVKEQLDDDHYGLKKAKERIIEFLAVMKLNKDQKTPLLCFYGPPGVGKTSVGISIAKALNRKYIRIAMGGVRDESEIRGHRRTYVGAMPGRIIQGLKNCETNNPIILIDEIDKIGRDGFGDPSSALLEVLDPEQNTHFRDNYVNLEFDLSKVLFIATANDMSAVPPALKDRMELIEFESYTLSEKAEIAMKYLITKQIGRHGIKRKDLSFPREMVKELIRNYTLEAGVRNLDRTIATICRKIAKRVATGNKNKVVINSAILKRFLGPPIYISLEKMKESLVGVATGLAWISVGGEVLLIEAARTPGKGNLKITGQLGDVMKESVQAALTFVKSRAKQLNIKLVDFAGFDIHIHFPDGATPKDGPSAGIATTTVFASLFSGKAVSNQIAMTGEIRLTGKVLPVGGIKEKVLAAYRHGIPLVILPKDNKH